MTKGKTTDFVQGKPFVYPTYGSKKQQQMFLCRTCGKEKQRRYFYGDELKEKCTKCKVRKPNGRITNKTNK